MSNWIPAIIYLCGGMQQALRPLAKGRLWVALLTDGICVLVAAAVWLWAKP